MRLVATKFILGGNELAMESTSGGLGSIAVINSWPRSVNALSGEVEC